MQPESQPTITCVAIKRLGAHAVSVGSDPMVCATWSVLCVGLPDFKHSAVLFLHRRTRTFSSPCRISNLQKLNVNSHLQRWRLSFGMWCHVVRWKCSDTSDECAAPFLVVGQSGEHTTSPPRDYMVLHPRRQQSLHTLRWEMQTLCGQCYQNFSIFKCLCLLVYLVMGEGIILKRIVNKFRWRVWMCSTEWEYVWMMCSCGLFGLG